MGLWLRVYTPVGTSPFQFDWFLLKNQQPLTKSCQTLVFCYFLQLLLCPCLIILVSVCFLGMGVGMYGCLNVSVCKCVHEWCACGVYLSGWVFLWEGGGEREKVSVHKWCPSCVWNNMSPKTTTVFSPFQSVHSLVKNFSRVIPCSVSNSLIDNLKISVHRTSC